MCKEDRKFYVPCPQKCQESNQILFPSAAQAPAPAPIPVAVPIPNPIPDPDPASDAEFESGKTPAIKVTSFGSAAWVRGQSGKIVPVYFTWITARFIPDIHVVVEIASDQNFKLILEGREVVNELSTAIPMKPGIYWWRAYPINKGDRNPVSKFYPSGVLVVDIYD